MSAENWVVSREVTERVEAYVYGELSDLKKYSNRSPLDESGIYSLHRLAAEIYALGWRDAERSVSFRENAVRQRIRESAVGAPTEQETP